MGAGGRAMASACGVSAQRARAHGLTRALPSERSASKPHAVSEPSTAPEPRLGRRTALTFPLLPAAAEEPVAAVGFEPRHAHRRAASRAAPGPRRFRGSTRRSSLSSPSQVPCQSSPSTQVTPVTKRLDSMVRRIAPVCGIDLMDLALAILPDPERAFGPGQPGIAAAAGRRDRGEHRPVFGSIFWMRSSAI